MPDRSDCCPPLCFIPPLPPSRPLLFPNESKNPAGRERVCVQSIGSAVSDVEKCRSSIIFVSDGGGEEIVQAGKLDGERDVTTKWRSLAPLTSAGERNTTTGCGRGTDASRQNNQIAETFSTIFRVFSSCCSGRLQWTRHTRPIQ